MKRCSEPKACSLVNSPYPLSLVPSQLRCFLPTCSRRIPMPYLDRGNAPAITLVVRQDTLKFLHLGRGQFRCSINQSVSTKEKENGKRTISSGHKTSFTFNLVQYRTCSVPLVRPGKNSAICFHVRPLASFNSTNRRSSAGVNLFFGPFGFGAGAGKPG